MDESILKKTFEAQIGKDVCSIYKFDNVPNNQVYKIETETQNYIFKIYAKRDWPEDGKIPFVVQKLDEYKIPHAKLYTFERNDENFPDGYLIEECLPGITADRLALSEDETKNLFKKLAVVVSRIHKIELKNYGYTGSGIAEWSTFSEFIYDMFDDCTSNLREQNIVDALKLNTIKDKLYQKLKECDPYPPVICHGDLSTKNVIVNSDDIVLIDWDDVQSLCWMSDVASLTFRMKLYYGDKANIYRNAFLNSYETEYNKVAFDVLEDYLHVSCGLDYLNFAVVTPNYHHQTETVKAILQKSLINCGTG
jgi:Ser/Thr protein kinase RdoA (MazF antagonist)